MVYNMDVFKGLEEMIKEGVKVDCVVTSPPYWGLRDYGCEGQIGLEEHPKQWVKKMVEVCSGLKRVLKPTGSLWLNLGDTYCGGGNFRTDNPEKDKDNKFMQEKKWHFAEQGGRTNIASKVVGSSNWLQAKQKMLMPHRLAIALQDDGWILRNDVVWHKPSHMPSSVRDRLTNSFEYLFHFVKQRKYFYDLDAIREPHNTTREEFIAKATRKTDRGWDKNNSLVVGMAHHKSGFNKYISKKGAEPNPAGKNPSDVWSINPEPFSEAHFACFPKALVRRPLKATCPKGGVVLDPFVGSGTTLQEAQSQGKRGIGIELNKDYISLIKKRLLGDAYQESLNKNKIKIITGGEKK